jgi:hypothetical protein
MATVTLRLPDGLLAECKQAAALEQLSLNGWMVRLVQAAVEPGNEPDGRSRLREKLRRAGILAEVEHRDNMPRPSPEELAEAMEAAAHGTSLSDIVSANRGPY